jgi:hypothetical protein
MKATAGLSPDEAERKQETISAIKDHNGTIITDSTEEANILNSY